jgi:hypothetical protein
MTLEEILDRLERAQEILAPMHLHMPRDISDATALELGQALGMILSAKGLVKIDIEEASQREGYKS